MLTLKSTANTAIDFDRRKGVAFNPINAYLKFLDGQKERKTMWWFINLMVHGNLILAVPAVLIYYYNAPGIVLGITVGGFFTNLIVNMGGAGIRVTLTAFYLSLLANAGMLLFYLL